MGVNYCSVVMFLGDFIVFGSLGFFSCEVGVIIERFYRAVVGIKWSYTGSVGDIVSVSK